MDREALTLSDYFVNSNVWVGSAMINGVNFSILRVEEYEAMFNEEKKPNERI